MEFIIFHQAPRSLLFKVRKAQLAIFLSPNDQGGFSANIHGELHLARSPEEIRDSPAKNNISKMSSTATYNAGSASASSTSQDEIILSRPRGVYTGECRSRRSSRDSNGKTRSASGGYDIRRRQQSLSRAIHTISMLKKADKTKVKTALSLQDWTPLPSLGYSSSPMEELCMEFARLATDLQNGWIG